MIEREFVLQIKADAPDAQMLYEINSPQIFHKMFSSFEDWVRDPNFHIYVKHCDFDGIIDVPGITHVFIDVS